METRSLSVEAIKELEEFEKVILDNTPEKVKRVPAMEHAGVIEKKEMNTHLRKSGYYAIFARDKSEHDRPVNQSIQNVNIARFESKADLKRVIV